MIAPLRYLPRPDELPRMNTAELRDAFLLANLFTPGALRLALTDADRLAVGGVIPFSPIALPPVPAFGTSYFTERRELGVFNLGAPGVVRVEGQRFELNRHDCLYIGTCNRDVTFEPAGDDAPVFYLAACPAHHAYPASLVRAEEAEAVDLGDAEHANTRRLRRYIYSGGVQSCQLVMGMTELSNGGIWNTMPPHTHSRRSEIYLYFDVPEDQVVFHFLGEPSETRHVVVRDREAVVSPPWSIHSGAGTASYRFIWAMAGDNMRFDDMDAAPLATIR